MCTAVKPIGSSNSLTCSTIHTTLVNMVSAPFDKIQRERERATTLGGFQRSIRRKCSSSDRPSTVALDPDTSHSAKARRSNRSMELTSDSTQQPHKLQGDNQIARLELPPLATPSFPSSTTRASELTPLPPELRAEQEIADSEFTVVPSSTTRASDVTPLPPELRAEQEFADSEFTVFQSSVARASDLRLGICTARAARRQSDRLLRTRSVVDSV